MTQILVYVDAPQNLRSRVGDGCKETHNVLLDKYCFLLEQHKDGDIVLSWTYKCGCWFELTISPTQSGIRK